jgi:AsmA protein
VGSIPITRSKQVRTMIKTTKYILAGLGGLILLVAIAAAAFLAVFDANAYKSEIAAKAQAMTGRKLEIGGDLKVSFFPWLAIEASDLKLANRTGFGNSPMLAVGKATARVKLMPLFSRRIEVGKVHVEGFALALERKADGSDNWSDIGATDAEPVAAPAAGGAPIDLSMEGVVIKDAAFTMIDAQAGTKLVVDDLDLETGPVTPGQPLEFKGSVHLESAAPALAATLGFSGRAAPKLASLDDLALTIDAEGATLPAPIKDGKLSIAKLTPGEPLKVDGMVLELWGVKLEGAVTMAGDELRGKLASAQFAPRAVMKTLGMEVPITADAKVLSSAKLEFEVYKRGDMMRIEDLAFTLDQTKFTGRVGIDSIERKALRFGLALDKIDADRYLPPVTKDEKVDSGLDEIELPTDSLQDHDIEGELRAKQLRVSNVDVSDLKMVVQARGGALELRSLTAKLYGGTVDARGKVDGRPQVPTAAFKLDLKNFKVGDFMQDAFGKTHATGVAALSYDLAGAGKTLGDVKRDLDGNIRFDIRQGTLEGFNVWKQARIAYAAYKKRPTTATADPDRTEFETLAGGADLKDGVATLVGVTAAIPFAAVTANGTVDLKADRLNVQAMAKITGAPNFGPKEDYSDIQGATLPIKVSGPFLDPSVSVDVLKAVVSTIKPDKILKDEKLRKKLKGIFG